MNTADSLRRLLRLIEAVEDGFVVVLVVAMVVLACLQILLRNVWGVGLVWADPLLRIMVLWSGLLGAMAATRTGNHISIDVLSRFLPAGLKRMNGRVLGVFSAVICAVLAWHGARFAWMEYEAQAISFYQIPSWVFELILPLGFAVMALRFILLAVLRPEEMS